MLRIKWFGHSMWLIESDQARIVCDPFDNIGYPMPNNLEADIVTSSHCHHDHNNFSLIKGDYTKITETGHYNYRNIDIQGFETYHDQEYGSKRGKNTIFRFDIDQKVILHCGDLGHVPEPAFFNKLGNIDMLMIPVGGVYTINANQAKQIIELIKPKVVLPMHYKTSLLNFNLDKLDSIKNLYPELIELSSDEMDFSELKNDKLALYSFKI